MSEYTLNLDHPMGPLMIINEGLDAEGVEHVREFPLMAVAAWCEMLGYADPADAMAAIIQDQDQRDPAGSTEEPFDEVVMLLNHREREREAEAEKVVQAGPGEDPRSPELAGALAAYRAVHMPINGGECLMDRARRKARGKLCVPHPDKRCGAASRAVPAETTGVLSECAEVVEQARRAFLHMISENPETPFASEQDETPRPAPMTIESIAEEYSHDAN